MKAKVLMNTSKKLKIGQEMYHYRNGFWYKVYRKRNGKFSEKRVSFGLTDRPLMPSKTAIKNMADDEFRAVSRYRMYADRCPDPKLAKMFREFEKDEKKHFHRLQQTKVKRRKPFV